MSVKYGTMTKLILITIEKRLIYFPGKKNIKKSQHKRYDFFYLIKRLRILFLITFLMKQLHMMIETLLGLTKM